MTAFIEAKGVDFSYEREGEATAVVKDLSLVVERGKKIVLLGRNGSGKSTLARLFTGLVLPDAGHIVTGGIDTTDDDHIFELRRKCGSVFQNPDNQIVGTTVEEDVAFGPENLGVPLPELRERVNRALHTVGLYDRREEAPANLSGGQKQKLGIAGILAMEPEGIILDEATSMLDPVSRRELLDLLNVLILESGLTAIHITHQMDEALDADWLFVLDEGRVALSGPPAEVLTQVTRLQELGLEAPFHLEFCCQLAELAGRKLTPDCIKLQGAADFAAACLQAGCGRLGQETGGSVSVVGDGESEDRDSGVAAADRDSSKQTEAGFVAGSSAWLAGQRKVSERLSSQPAGPAIVVEGLTYSYEEYGRGRPALKDVSFRVERGECFGIMGQTGSGKSTLVQHFNGLLRPQLGSVHVLDLDTRDKKQAKALRRRVGLLFQYPEHQLFAESCYDDIAFGPRQFGFSEVEVADRVKAATLAAGLTEDLLDRSPFALSGGQKRRVALAGVLALRPDVLVLDEPAAGLDPVGKADVLRHVQALKEQGVTIVLVSHDMTELARLSDRVLLLDCGQVQAVGPPVDLFSRGELLASCRLDVPEPVRFLKVLADRFPDQAPPFSLLPGQDARGFWELATAGKVVR